MGTSYYILNNYTLVLFQTQRETFLRVSMPDLTDIKKIARETSFRAASRNP